MKKNKKSQTEMMGIVVVVILITLALLFVLSFIVLRKPSTLKKQYTQSEIAANTLNALLETTTPCNRQRVRELLQDCAANAPGTIYCPGGLYSCDYTESVINELFDKTLAAWNIQFEFTATLTNIKVSRGYCSGEKKSQSQFIPTDAGVMTAKLDICS
jgi:hypothetical protein